MSPEQLARLRAVTFQPDITLFEAVQQVREITPPGWWATALLFTEPPEGSIVVAWFEQAGMPRVPLIVYPIPRPYR